MRTVDLLIFEIEQRLFETLTTPSGWFSPPKLEWENSRVRTLHLDGLLCETFEPV
jgi:hypothetical protein